MGEAQPVALTCSVLPDRHGQWTPRLLAGRMVALGHVASPEAKRLADRLEIHHTPEHGSRLNIAVIELSALGRQCLDGQIEDGPTLARRIGAWQRAARNAAAVTVAWRFTTADARIKLRKLYPSIDG